MSPGAATGGTNRDRRFFSGRCSESPRGSGVTLWGPGGAELSGPPIFLPNGEKSPNCPDPQTLPEPQQNPAGDFFLREGRGVVVFLGASSLSSPSQDSAPPREGFQPHGKSLDPPGVGGGGGNWGHTARCPGEVAAPGGGGSGRAPGLRWRAATLPTFHRSHIPETTPGVPPRSPGTTVRGGLLTALAAARSRRVRPHPARWSFFWPRGSFGKKGDPKKGRGNPLGRPGEQEWPGPSPGGRFFPPPQLHPRWPR